MLLDFGFLTMEALRLHQIVKSCHDEKKRNFFFFNLNSSKIQRTRAILTKFNMRNYLL